MGCKTWVVFAITLAAAWAQVTGSINGTLIDATQAAVAGATLILTNTQTGETRVATSSEQSYFRNIDFAAQKNFPVTESRHVEFRSSLYNVLNHANLGNPNTTVLNSTFGRITSVSTPRVIELAPRVVF